MNVQFLSIDHPEGMEHYLEEKWEKVAKDHLPAYDDIALRHVFLAQSAKSEDFGASKNSILPPLSPEEEQVLQELAEHYLPHIPGESPTSAPEIFAFKGNDNFPSGTLALKWKTNFSEMVFFFPEMRVMGEFIYRHPLQNPASEEIFKRNPAGRLWVDFKETDVASDESALADPITLGLIAKTVLLGLISGAASQVGGKAISWALKELGLNGFLGDHSNLSYDQLVQALKTQSREDYRRDIQVAFNKYHRKLDDYNNGARTIAQLNEVYNETVNLVSMVQEDERNPDRVLFLAVVQCAYLAIMQERAEWWRGKDPEKLKSFYEAFTKAAAREMEILRKVQIEAEEYRLAKISMPKKRRDIFGWLVYFDDVIKPDDNWHRYSIACARWGHRGGFYQCLEWTHDTPSYRNALQRTIQARDRHVPKIHAEVEHALRGLEDTYQHMAKISRMEVPPPPPK